MMGGFQFISVARRIPDGADRAIRVGLIAAAAVATLALAGAGSASIDLAIGQRDAGTAPARLPDVAAPPKTAPLPAPTSAPETPAALPEKAQVSMSALGAPPTSRPGEGSRAHDVPDDFPLTRAAARQRIESMSPAGWLAHYGPVSVDRHE